MPAICEISAWQLGEITMDAKWQGARLAEIRKAAGFATQKALALAFAPAKTQGAIGNWEADIRTPDVNDLKDLCDILGVWSDTFYKAVGSPIRWRKVYVADPGDEFTGGDD